MHRLSFAALLAAFVTLIVPASLVAADSPTLMWSTARGYDLALTGSNWPANDTVGVELTQGANTYGVVVQTNNSGTFVVGFTNFSCSQGGTAEAKDLSRNEAGAPVLDPCGRGKAKTPVLTVLTGTRLTPALRNLSGFGTGKTVKVTQGHEVRLWEKGTKSPSIEPSVVEKYLFLVGHQPGTNPSCMSNCAAGFTWTWLALTPGSTGITLRPYCNGQMCPQDWVAEIRLDILRPH